MLLQVIVTAVSDDNYTVNQEFENKIIALFSRVEEVNETITDDTASAEITALYQEHEKKISDIFGPLKIVQGPVSVIDGETLDENNTVNPELKNNTTPDASDLPEENCKCVPMYLCSNGTVITNGTGLIGYRYVLSLSL